MTYAKVTPMKNEIQDHIDQRRAELYRLIDQPLTVDVVSRLRAAANDVLGLEYAKKVINE